MMVLENINRWLKGSFICERCGRTVHLLTFGYGTVRCLRCYEGERLFLVLDVSYWLNRLLCKLGEKRGDSELDVSYFSALSLI